MNLIEAIQERCAELREVYIPAYESPLIAGAGALAVMLMKDAMRRAEARIAIGDTVGMIASLQELRDFEL